MLEVERGIVSHEAMNQSIIKFIANESLPSEIERINLDWIGMSGDLRKLH